MTKRYILVAQILFVVGLLAAWEIGARTGTISTFLFASPSMVLEVIIDRVASARIWVDMYATLSVQITGYALGAVFGSFIGLTLWYSRIVADFAQPFIAAIWATPTLAIAPMTIIWFGTGMESKVAIVIFVTIVVALTNAYSGSQRADVDLINLMRSFGASNSKIFRSVVIPGALPWVMQGLKLSVGLSMVGTIVAEYISSSVGLGNMILVGSNNFSMNLVLAGITIVIAIVWLQTALMNRIEKLVLKWEAK